ncbi:MAG: mannosyltransferase family protein [Actinomycetota bacterium]
MSLEATAPPQAPPEPGAEPQRSEPQPQRRLWDESFAYCLKIFVALRLGLWLIGVLAVGLLTPNSGLGDPVTPGWHNMFTAWNRWDVTWYLKIASHGYASNNGTAAFFPLYPGLVHALGVVFGRHWLVAAYLVSNLCFLAAMIVVYKLSQFEFDSHVARRTVLYMAVFPTSFFFLAPYSESLFLLLTVSTLFAARKQRWLTAGLLGIFAALTRSIGVALILPLGLEAMSQAGWLPHIKGAGRSLAKTAGALAASILPAAGLLIYLGYWRIHSGDWLVPFKAQAGWARQFSWPWDTIVNGTKVGLQFIGSFPGGYHSVDLLLVTISFGAAIWVCRRTAPIYWSYTIVSLIVPLFLVFGGRPFMSLPRFVLMLWPLFWALVAFADRFKANQLVVAASAAGLGMLGLLFVNWYWVF